MTETEEVTGSSPDADRYIDLNQAVDILRRLLFGADTEAPLSRMEYELLRAGRPGTQSKPGSIVPGSVVYTCAGIEMFPNTPGSADYERAQARAYRLKVQNEACERWLDARGLLSDLPNGRTVARLAKIEAAVAAWTASATKAAAVAAPTVPAPTTALAERNWRSWLAGQMRAAPTRPRSKVVMKKEGGVARLPRVSDRAFDRAWRNAVEDADAPAWSNKGRRKESPHR